MWNIFVPFWCNATKRLSQYPADNDIAFAFDEQLPLENELLGQEISGHNEIGAGTNHG